MKNIIFNAIKEFFTKDDHTRPMGTRTVEPPRRRVTHQSDRAYSPPQEVFNLDYNTSVSKTVEYPDYMDHEEFLSVHTAKFLLNVEYIFRIDRDVSEELPHLPSIKTCYKIVVDGIDEKNRVLKLLESYRLHVLDVGCNETSGEKVFMIIVVPYFDKTIEFNFE